MTISRRTFMQFFAAAAASSVVIKAKASSRPSLALTPTHPSPLLEPLPPTTAGFHLIEGGALAVVWGSTDKNGYFSFPLIGCASPLQVHVQPVREEETSAVLSMNYRELKCSTESLLIAILPLRNLRRGSTWLIQTTPT